MGSARIICGTSRSWRTQQIDVLARDHWGRVRLLVPTRQCAQRRLESLLLNGPTPLSGAWGRPVLTMDDFATEILHSAHIDPIRIRDAERRLLLRQAIMKCADLPAVQTLGAAGETQGFASHVLRIIVQLKQAAIDPQTFQKCLQRRDPHHAASPLDEAVAAIYSAYQDVLLDAKLYDLPGLFWTATDILYRERPRTLRSVDTVLLDGFDDFTPSEFRLLEALAPYVETLVFGLNYDIRGERQDVYRVTARTAQQIGERFDTSSVICEEPAPDTYTAFASQHLFWRDRPPDRETFAQGNITCDLELLACPDPTQEIEILARRVKQLLIDEQVAPDQIALVFRNLGQVAPVLRSTFESFEIPLRIKSDRPLADSAISAFIMSALDAVEQWPREAVVDVLVSPWLGWRSPHATTFRALARAAQVMTGFDEWQFRVGSLQKRIANDSRDESTLSAKRVTDAPGALTDLLAGLDRLRVIGQGILQKGTLLDFARALELLLNDLDIARALENAHDTAAPICEYEASALTAWRELLAAWRLWHARHPITFARNEFMALLRQVLNETGVTIAQPQDAVTCLDIESARHLAFDYVFFGRCIEGDVPKPPSKNAIYGEEDLVRLAGLGIRLDDRRVHSEREILLFHQMLNVARRHLCISWHSFTRDGREQYPSPYVRDLRELFPPNAIEGPALRSNAFVTEVNRAVSLHDLRNAVYAASDSVPDDVLALFTRAHAGAALETQRQSADPFEMHDGVLQDPDLIAEMTRRFGEQHAYSVNQIETYVMCPFQFFVERVLNVNLRKIPEAEFDAMVRGSILHAVLQAFHVHYRGEALCQIPEEEACATMRTYLQALFDDKAWRSITAPRGVTAIERRRLDAQLARYLLIEREQSSPDRLPTHFEVSFGRTPDDGPPIAQDPLTRAEPFALDTPLGTVLFAGRIDRIDRIMPDENESPKVCILDYKTTIQVTASDIREGRSIQLGLYALALEESLMPGASVEEAVFQAIGSEKRLDAIQRKKNEWPDRAENIRKVVAASVEGIRSGRFTPTPAGGLCTHCPVAELAPGRACRYDKNRITLKEAQP